MVFVAPAATKLAMYTMASFRNKLQHFAKRKLSRDHAKSQPCLTSFSRSGHA